MCVRKELLEVVVGTLTDRGRVVTSTVVERDRERHTGRKTDNQAARQPCMHAGRQTADRQTDT